MSSTKEIDVDVLKKFNQQGPRYTSYPTAPMFSTEFTSEDFKREVVDTNHGGAGDISLYFHFPFCEKLCYFCGCNMMVTHDRQAIKTYNEYLKKEVDTLKPLIDSGRMVEQMH